ncbi:MAG: phBC6A51 family helix-turn-helix protein [Minisyncoccales bacterium]
MKKDKIKDSMIVVLKEMPIVQVACKKVGVGRTTYYRWRESKKFAREADAAITEGEAFITDMSESQLISLIRDRNFQALQLWLRHHHPKYGNKVEISGRLTHSDEELTPEQMALVKTALRLASFDKKP